jgi:hypothetical protein
MKKNLHLLIFFLSLYQTSFSQILKTTSGAATEIFTNFHYSINDTSQTTGFGIERALFGYIFPSVNNFSATVILNVGSPEDLAEGSESRRYAHFREAFISYSKDKLTINAGMTKTLLATYQQIFLGKRYIADNLMSMRGYGYVSDIGVSVWYKFNDIVNADFALMNGEGYSNIQSDNNIKASAGLLITPSGKMAIRLFGDITKKEGNWQSTLVSFTGYKNDHVLIGAEFSYKRNMGIIEGYHVWGFSGTGGINLSESVGIFARYDFYSSVRLHENDIERWNYLNDGSLAVAGVEYLFSNKIKLSLNFQGTYPYDKNQQNSELIYLNTLFRF